MEFIESERTHFKNRFSNFYNPGKGPSRRICKPNTSYDKQTMLDNSKQLIKVEKFTLEDQQRQNEEYEDIKKQTFVQIESTKYSQDIIDSFVIERKCTKVNNINGSNSQRLNDNVFDLSHKRVIFASGGEMKLPKIIKIKRMFRKHYK